MPLPRFTIVTPTLNAGRFVQHCLDSVRAQDYPSVEHLVVDGGSTDETEALCRQAGATWLYQPGLNQSAAINHGFVCATGDVFAWLNADDSYQPNALARVAAAFTRDGSLDAVYGDCEVVGVQGEHLWWERPGPYDYERLTRRGNYLAQPAVFLRRRTVEELGYLDESLEYAMDYELWLRLRDCKVSYLPHPLARFCWHPDSKSARGQRAAWRENIRVLRQHGHGWTPELAYAYVRCLFTVTRGATLARLGLDGA